MRDFTHNTSNALELIEKCFSTHDVEMLHRKYEEVRYRFLTAEEFCTICQFEWYHFDLLFNKLFVKGKKLVANDFTHGWVTETIKDNVIKWFNQMLVDNRPIIEIGTPATVYYYSDHRAATITMVEFFKNGKKDAAGNPIPKKIGVNLNEAKCIDYYNGEYEVIPMTAPEDLKKVRHIFTFRKGGHWVSEKDHFGDGLTLGIGYQSHFIDPSF